MNTNFALFCRENDSDSDDSSIDGNALDVAIQGDGNEINNMITDMYSKNSANKTSPKSNIKSTSIFDPNRPFERKKVSFGSVEVSNGDVKSDQAKRKASEDSPNENPAKQPKRSSSSSAGKRGEYFADRFPELQNNFLI